jgi:hypothetical protein
MQTTSVVLFPISVECDERGTSSCSKKLDSLKKLKAGQSLVTLISSKYAFNPWWPKQCKCHNLYNNMRIISRYLWKQFIKEISASQQIESYQRQNLEKINSIGRSKLNIPQTVHRQLHRHVTSHAWMHVHLSGEFLHSSVTRLLKNISPHISLHNAGNQKIMFWNSPRGKAPCYE